MKSKEKGKGKVVNLIGEFYLFLFLKTFLIQVEWDPILGLSIIGPTFYCQLVLQKKKKNRDATWHVIILFMKRLYFHVG